MSSSSYRKNLRERDNNTKYFQKSGYLQELSLKKRSYARIDWCLSYKYNNRHLTSSSRKFCRCSQAPLTTPTNEIGRCSRKSLFLLAVIYYVTNQLNLAIALLNHRQQTHIVGLSVRLLHYATAKGKTINQMEWFQPIKKMCCYFRLQRCYEVPKQSW